MIEPEDKPKENPEDESQDSQSLFTIRLYPKLPLRPYYCRVKVLNASSRRLFVCDLGYSYSSLDNPIKDEFIRLQCNPYDDKNANAQSTSSMESPLDMITTTTKKHLQL